MKRNMKRIYKGLVSGLFRLECYVQDGLFNGVCRREYQRLY